LPADRNECISALADARGPIDLRSAALDEPPEPHPGSGPSDAERAVLAHESGQRDLFSAEDLAPVQP
jgi:hypothetical protein